MEGTGIAPQRSPARRPPVALDDERRLLAALRAGDERAFAALVDAYAPSMLRLAMTYVPSRAVADEVLQETWLGVLRGLDRFEGRSSLKTWIFRIVANRAKTRALRERRSTPFASLADAGGDDAPAVDPDRFFGPDHDRHPGHWMLGPAPWELPEEGLLARETRELIVRAIEALPAGQRAVVTLRDVEGWPAEEVCAALDISEVNQRVLLHRARSRLRAALEDYLGAVAPTT